MFTKKWRITLMAVACVMVLHGCGGGSGGDSGTGGGVSPPPEPPTPTTPTTPLPWVPSPVPPISPPTATKALSLVAGSAATDWSGCGDVSGAGVQTRFAQIDNAVAFDEQGVLYLHESLPCDVPEVDTGLGTGKHNITADGSVLRLAKKLSLSLAPEATLEPMTVSGLPSNFYLSRLLGVHPRKDAIYFSAKAYLDSGFTIGGSSSFVPGTLVGRVREGVLEILGQNGWGVAQAWQPRESLFRSISSSAMSAEGVLYVSDEGRIRKIDAQGKINDDLTLKGYSLSTDSTGQVYVVNDRFELVHVDTGRILARNVPINQNVQELDCLNEEYSRDDPGYLVRFQARYPLYRCLTRIAFASPTDIYAATDTVVYKLQKNDQWIPVLGAVGDQVYGRALHQIRALTTTPQGELFMVENFGVYRINVSALSSVPSGTSPSSVKLTPVAGSTETGALACGDALGSASAARFRKGVYNLAADAQGDLLLADTLACGQSDMIYNAPRVVDNTILGKKIAASRDFSVTPQATPANWHLQGTISRIVAHGDTTYFVSPQSLFKGKENDPTVNEEFPRFVHDRVWRMRSGIHEFLTLDGWKTTMGQSESPAKDLAVDASGVVYVNQYNEVWKLSPEGMVNHRYTLNESFVLGLNTDLQGQVHVLNNQFQLMNLETQKVVAHNVPSTTPLIQRNSNRTCYRDFEHLCKTQIAFTSPTDIYAASNNVLYKLQADGQWKPLLGAVNGQVYGRVLNNLRAITSTPQGKLYLMENYALYRVDPN